MQSSQYKLTLPSGLMMADIRDFVPTDVMTWSLQQSLPRELANSAMVRQTAFLAGRFCAVQALYRLGHEASGCLPRLADRRVAWPAGYVGSISHSGDQAIALVGHRSQWQSVAVDVQTWMPDEQATRVSGRVLLPSEQDWVNQQPKSTHAAWVSRIFSIKETVYKLLYHEALRYMPFDAAEVIQWSPTHVVVCLSKDWSSRWRRGHCLTVYRVDDPVAVLTWAALAQPVHDGSNGRG